MQNITSFSEWTLFLPHDKDSVEKERIIVKRGHYMSKLSRLIEQVEMAQTLLSLQMEREQLRMNVEHLTNLLTVYQKVSLAETKSQVKNACSHMSSTNEENLIHLRTNIL